MKHFTLFSILMLLLFSQNSFAQKTSQVQSAYMYHFTKYMEWPSSKQSGGFIIGVVGDTPIQPYLNSMAATKKAGTQNIVIKRFSSAAAITNCHMIYLPANKSNQLATVIAKGKQYHALVITEKAGLGSKGAGINFITKDGKARFEINENSIGQNKIKVSAKLVQMGIKV